MNFICCSVAIVIIIVIILLFYVNKLACKDQILQFYPRRLGVYNSAGVRRGVCNRGDKLYDGREL